MSDRLQNEREYTRRRDAASLPTTPYALSPTPCRLRSVLAFFCVIMVLFAATLRVAHSHTAAEQESGHCPICVAIHTGIPTASAPVQVCLHAAPEPVVTPTPKAPAKVRVEVLSDRAPPAYV